MNVDIEYISTYLSFLILKVGMIPELGILEVPNECSP